MWKWGTVIISRFRSPPFNCLWFRIIYFTLAWSRTLRWRSTNIQRWKCPTGRSSFWIWYYPSWLFLYVTWWWILIIWHHFSPICLLCHGISSNSYLLIRCFSHKVLSFYKWRVYLDASRNLFHWGRSLSRINMRDFTFSYIIITNSHRWWCALTWSTRECPTALLRFSIAFFLVISYLLPSTLSMLIKYALGAYGWRS